MNGQGEEAQERSKKELETLRRSRDTEIGKLQEDMQTWKKECSVSNTKITSLEKQIAELISKLSDSEKACMKKDDSIKELRMAIDKEKNNVLEAAQATFRCEEKLEEVSNISF